MEKNLPSPDELMSSELEKPAIYANMFRARADNTVSHTVVFDFGYLPPILPLDLPSIVPGCCKVHTRIAVPFEIAKDIANSILEAVQKAEEEKAQKY
jgi:hypothetical protein